MLSGDAMASFLSSAMVNLRRRCFYFWRVNVQTISFRNIRPNLVFWLRMASNSWTVYTRISDGTGRLLRFQLNERRSNRSDVSSTTAIKSRSLPTPQSFRVYDPKYPRRSRSDLCRACSADHDRTAWCTSL
jgi:hypothetical protein